MVPKQKRLNSDFKMPAVAMAAPAIPNTELVINPNRRPTRCMYKEAGMVVAIWAKNKRASGRVANDLILDKLIPTSAQEDSRRDVPVIRMAWLRASRVTLRFIFRIRLPGNFVSVRIKEIPLILIPNFTKERLDFGFGKVLTRREPFW